MKDKYKFIMTEMSHAKISDTDSINYKVYSTKFYKRLKTTKKNKGII